MEWIICIVLVLVFIGYRINKNGKNAWKIKILENIALPNDIFVPAMSISVRSHPEWAEEGDVKEIFKVFCYAFTSSTIYLAKGDYDITSEMARLDARNILSIILEDDELSGLVFDKFKSVLVYLNLIGRHHNFETFSYQEFLSYLSARIINM